MANSQACGSLIFNGNLLTSTNTDNCNVKPCLLSTSDPNNHHQHQQQQLQSQQQQQQCSVNSNSGDGHSNSSSSTNLPQLFKTHSHYHPAPQLPPPPPPHQHHHHHHLQSQQQQTNCILYSNSNNFRTHNSHLSNSTLSLNDSSGGSIKGHNNSSSLNLSPIGSPLPVGICGSPSCNGHLCLTSSCSGSSSCNNNSPASPLSASSKEQLRQLFEACKVGDIAKVKLLANTRNVNARDTCIGNSLRKSTCLHFASGKSWI